MKTLFPRWLTALLLVSLPLLAHSAPVMVDTAWVEQHLDDPDLVLIDMSREETQYQRFHLPGAAYLPYQILVRMDRNGVSLRVSDERLYQILGILGIGPDSHVVVYDDMGGLSAGRLFWELERIGHSRISVLDGGSIKWTQERRPVSSQPVEPSVTQYRPASTGRANEADIDAVKSAMNDGRTVLLDVRSEEEYRGSPQIARSGHIPGAQWWPWEKAIRFESDAADRESTILMASLKKAGVTRKTPVITYCRTGHRASRSYLTLRRLGFENVRMYDGSMLEWEKAKAGDAPMKTGMKP